VPVTELRVEGYRSIRDLSLSLKRANIIVGANGCGKSNLYNSMALIKAAAEGRLSRTVADEGGMASVLWAGGRKDGPVRMKLGITLDEYTYSLELGLPQNALSMFLLDPNVKEERLCLGKSTVMERGVSSYKIVDADGARQTGLMALHHSEALMAQVQDARQFPLLDDLRRRILKWRFYHTFRTDAGSPLRRPQTGVRTYALADDGADLAAALQTIRENGDGEGLDAAIADAFPQGRLRIVSSVPGTFAVVMEFPGVGRPLQAHELSDGTLRYLCLLAALMSPDPPPLLALNEPETSLHEDLLPPLARLIAQTAVRSQIWLTTHAEILVRDLEELLAVKPIRLAKEGGATVRAGRPNGLAYSAEWDG
jgi:predicted ATPase